MLFVNVFVLAVAAVLAARIALGGSAGPFGGGDLGGYVAMLLVNDALASWTLGDRTVFYDFCRNWEFLFLSLPGSLPAWPGLFVLVPDWLLTLFCWVLSPSYPDSCRPRVRCFDDLEDMLDRYPVWAWLV